MKFDEAINYIKSLDIYGSVLGLDNMRVLANELDNPQSGLKFIHVTGTNGKGSVCSFLAHILTDAGYRIGAYNSPAVISDTDQYTINTEAISEELYAEAVTLVKSACDQISKEGGNHPTRFEVETMVAFVAFNIDKCDIVILETGLGGRDDATNIADNKVLNVFTSISLDHCAVLGDTRAEIAEVKAGIIKSSAPVVMYAGISESDNDSDQYNDVINVIRIKCSETGANFTPVYSDDITNVHMQNKKLRFSIPKLDFIDASISMTASYQPVNAEIAVFASKVLKDNGYTISDENIRNGLKKARIPFRFERVKAVYKKEKVDIILDGAHNPDGAKRLMESLELNYPDREFIFVTGIFKDKDYEKIAEITGAKAKTVYAVENDLSQRALSRDDLTAVLLKYNDNIVNSESIESAIDSAISEAIHNDIQTSIANSGLFINQGTADKPVIVCFGSLSWLNRAKSYIKDTYKKNKDDVIENKPKLKKEHIMEEEKYVVDSVTFDELIGDIGEKFAVDKKETAVDSDKIKEGVKLILEGIGEDINREGLIDTPDRVVRMYEEIFSGLGKTAEYDLGRTFTATSKDMVLEKDITFYSMCEHHLMPFYGKAHIAYIPDGKVVGISKLARCVEVYAKKPQIQERLTEEIADAIMAYLKPKGVMVMIEAEHMCMTMRGVKKPGTKTVTVTSRGKMKRKENQDLFFNLLGKKEDRTL